MAVAATLLNDRCWFNYSILFHKLQLSIVRILCLLYLFINLCPILNGVFISEIKIFVYRGVSFQRCKCKKRQRDVYKTSLYFFMWHEFMNS